MTIQQKINKISIVIPSKDDEITLIKHIDDLLVFCEKYVLNFEVIIVVNGSEEKNITTLKDFLSKKNLENFKILYSEIVGKGAAVKMGIKNSNFDHILITDADFSVKIDHLINFLDKSFKPLGSFVVGTRKSKGSKVVNTPITRKLTGFIYTFLVKNLLKINVDDTQCGFKLLNKKEFSNVADFRSIGFSYDIELFLLAKKNKIVPIEIPVKYIHEKNSNINVLSDSKKMFSELFEIRNLYL